MSTVPQFGRRYYSLHICEGLTSSNGKTLLVQDSALRRMDPSFEGKPVVFLEDHINLEIYDRMVEEYRKTGKLDSKILAGVVSKSFFNEQDGKHWVEYVVWMPAAIAACESGMKVSNGYWSTRDGGEGTWHGFNYDVEVLDGEYTHLLLTDQPRYTESITLTPERYGEYNEAHRKQLAEVKNTLEGAKPMAKKGLFGFLKSENVEEVNLDRDTTLPKSKRTINVAEVLNEMDEAAVKEDKGEMYANMDHKVKLHDNSVCNVGELIEKYKGLAEEHSNAMEELEEYRKATGGEKKGEGEHANESPEEKKKREEEEAKKKEEANKESHNKSEEQKKRLEEVRNRVGKLKEGGASLQLTGGVADPRVQREVYTRQDALAAGHKALGGKKKSS